MQVHRYLATTNAMLLILMLAWAAAAAAQTGGPQTVLASRIIDGEVYDADAQRIIGEVDDLIIRRGGRVKQVTVEFGGFLDIGDKLVALSFKSFGMKNGRMTLAATKNRLEKKRAFDYFEHGLQPAYLYRPRPPFAGPYRFPQESMYYGPHAPNPGLAPYAWARSPSKFLASSILDRRLIDETGELLGMVVDLVIDRTSMAVSRIVVAANALVGDAKRLQLPYEPLDFTAWGLVYDIGRAELKEPAGSEGR